jgi:hypothetical protein
MSQTKSVILGWDAPPIFEQFPQLCPRVGNAFQRDHDELLRLKLREIIPPAEHNKAIQRLVKHILKAVEEVKS